MEPKRTCRFTTQFTTHSATQFTIRELLRPAPVSSQRVASRVSKRRSSPDACNQEGLLCGMFVKPTYVASEQVSIFRVQVFSFSRGEAGHRPKLPQRTRSFSLGTLSCSLLDLLWVPAFPLDGNEVSDPPVSSRPKWLHNGENYTSHEWMNEFGHNT